MTANFERQVRRSGPATAVLWEHLSGPELGELLTGDPTHVGLIPVGATEQHGPHLPTGTDSLIATRLCLAVSELTGALVLPTVSVASSYGHGQQLAGTLSLRPRDTADVVTSMIQWAASSGLKRFLLVNAHAGNLSSLGIAIDELRHDRPDLRVGIVNWWQADPTVRVEAVVDGDDWHGNRTETSVMLALAPELVDPVSAMIADDEDRTANLVFRYTAPSLSTNGVTGRPSESSLELGRDLVQRATAAIADRVDRGRAEEPPLVNHVPPDPRPRAPMPSTRTAPAL
jgi:creatinine amidohydrolase